MKFKQKTIKDSIKIGDRVWYVRGGFKVESAVVTAVALPHVAADVSATEEAEFDLEHDQLFATEEAAKQSLPGFDGTLPNEEDLRNELLKAFGPIIKACDELLGKRT